MTLQELVRTVLSKYATFTGRASRSEFWWWCLVVFLVGLVLGAVEGSMFGNGYGILSGISRWPCSCPTSRWGRGGCTTATVPAGGSCCC